MNDVWGYSLHLNIHGCPNEKSTRTAVQSFIDELCRRIDMEKHGRLFYDEFGEGYLHGPSFVQMIKTSSITGHFDPNKNTLFLDVFSCKTFEPKVVEDFVQEYFGAEIRDKTWMERK